MGKILGYNGYDFAVPFEIVRGEKMKRIRATDIEPELIESRRIAMAVERMIVPVSPDADSDPRNVWYDHNHALYRVLKSIRTLAKRRRGVREASLQRMMVKK
jgi:hypothetical protein